MFVQLSCQTPTEVAPPLPPTPPKESGRLYIRERSYSIDRMAEVAYMIETKGRLSRLQPQMSFRKIALKCRVGDEFDGSHC